MMSEAIALTAFRADHLAGAAQLSQQAGWPHRLEDWQMALALSEGCAAVSSLDNRVVGTVLMTPYGEDAATINMVIVDEAARGRGLGRKLMDAVLSLAGDRSLRLIATESGLPLYEKLGFQGDVAVVQHQGRVARSVAAPAGVRPARIDDIPAIMDLDREAFGADRGRLMSHLANVGSLAVLERAGRASGFSALRRFGRGEMIGPVVAADIDDAKALMSHFLSSRANAFVRVDTDATTGLGPWLADIGLVHVDGGIAMSRPALAAPNYRSIVTFALANQAFG